MKTGSTPKTLTETIVSLKTEIHDLNPLGLKWGLDHMRIIEAFLQLPATEWRAADIAWVDDFLTYHATLNHYVRRAEVR